MARLRLVLVVACGAACGRTAPSGAHPNAEASRQPARPQNAAAEPAGVLADAGGAREAAHWRGSYHSEPARIFVPPDWKGVRWVVPDTTAGQGDGTVTLQIDGSGRRVTGTIEGPLGPATVEGAAYDGGVTASVVRRDPADRGFTGTLVAAHEGERLRGTMHLSLAEASAVRSAEFSLSLSPGSP